MLFQNPGFSKLTHELHLMYFPEYPIFNMNQRPYHPFFSTSSIQSQLDQETTVPVEVSHLCIIFSLITQNYPSTTVDCPCTTAMPCIITRKKHVKVIRTIITLKRGILQLQNCARWNLMIILHCKIRAIGDVGQNHYESVITLG